jgi:hypothetical protein
MAKWKKKELKMAAGHGWRARPGHKIFVADRGALRFDYPVDWVFTPGATSCVFKDPGDNCVLEVSFVRLPPIDWSGLPLLKLLMDVDAKDGRSIPEEQIVRVQRPDLEYVWSEHTFMDPGEHREAIGRTCLARGQNVQALITFAFWPEDRERFTPAWDEALRSLQLGIYIADPKMGPRLH